MADGVQNLGNLLAGFGAGVQGRGSEFIQGLQAEQEQAEQLEENRVKAMAQDALIGLNFLKKGDTDSTVELLQNRVDNINRLGGDPSDTMETLEALKAGNVDFAINDLQSAVDISRVRGILPEEDGGKFIERVGTQAIFKTDEGVEAREIQGLQAGSAIESKEVQSSKILPGGMTQITFKDGSVELVSLGDDDKKLVRAAEDRGVSLQEARAGAREKGTKEERRGQDLINRGVLAAESTANIRRGLELLDKVETGGPAAISLAVRERLGIEGADEGELSSSLGKAVLSQLRETFGAAFTAAEGDQLKRIEAGFGKSTARNRRLLQRVLQIAERTARRGLKAANQREDAETAQDIDELLKFNLSFDDPKDAKAGDVKAEQATTDGQTIGRFTVKVKQ